jgi:hypothetical protein
MAWLQLAASASTSPPQSRQKFGNSSTVATGIPMMSTRPSSNRWVRTLAVTTLNETRCPFSHIANVVMGIPD